MRRQWQLLLAFEAQREEEIKSAPAAGRNRSSSTSRDALQPDHEREQARGRRQRRHSTTPDRTVRAR
jgi:hypothetical protein